MTEAPVAAARRPAGRSPLQVIRASLSLAVVGTVVAMTYARLYFGVDLTDESFYVAVPFRFVLGKATAATIRRIRSNEVTPAARMI